jgi:quinol monooxygenase YgiN
MSTHVVNEFHGKPGHADDVLAPLLELSPESRGRRGCEPISIRRNQDDPDSVIGDTRWATRQHYDDCLALRTQNGYTTRFDQMLSEPMLIRYQVLCGHPHKSAYSDLRVMPSDSPDPW